MINNDKPSQILIVDDSQLDLELLDHFMRENGYRTVTAQTGAEALEFIQSNTPDLILLDMMMPIMDGISVCEQLKVQEGTHNIPVIFITALSDIQHKIEAFKVGGVDYIVKPFIQEEVLARVNVHLKLKKALEKLEEMSPVCQLGVNINFKSKSVITFFAAWHNQTDINGLNSDRESHFLPTVF
jgi:DNA-binding response OmpR family regulator